MLSQGCLQLSSSAYNDKEKTLDSRDGVSLFCDSAPARFKAALTSLPQVTSVDSRARDSGCVNLPQRKSVGGLVVSESKECVISLRGCLEAA